MNGRVDIAVIGGGAAGIAAAISAARAGCSTLLLDQRAGPGGTGGFSGLTTLCGLYDDKGEFLNDGFPADFARAVGDAKPVRMGRLWVLPYRPEKFRETAARLITAERTLQVESNTPLRSVQTGQAYLPSDRSGAGNRILRINDWDLGAVIDCTGSAEVARAAGVDCLETDETTQAPAVIFPLLNVKRDLSSAAGAAAALLPLARAGYPPLSLQPAADFGSVTAKFTGPPQQAPEVIEFLRRNVQGFEECSTPVTEFSPARRAGRMISGRYLLTGKNVLEGQKFSDAIARCSWPIEQWDSKGRVSLRYLPAGTCYEIPVRCLQASRVENLFMAGKTISADIDAIASARVMGCCLATGAAAGHLAAEWLASESVK